MARSLNSFRLGEIRKPPKSIRKKDGSSASKGKRPEGNVIQNSTEYAHKMSLITQIQELFPDLGSAYIAALLDEYHDSTEDVTAHILEGSPPPPHLQSFDRAASLPPFTEPLPRGGPAPHPDPLGPPPLELSARRNIHDDDALDTLSVPPSSIHLGRKETGLARLTAADKVATLSALEAFDPDDDERDDTYDVGDVGGTVDMGIPGNEDLDSREPQQPTSDTANEGGGIDSILYPAWKEAPEQFSRNSDIRRGNFRASLRQETGLTDEAIEGWASMLQRDSKRLSRLKAAYDGPGAFDGRQTDLERTAYRREKGAGAEATDESDTGGGPGERGGLGGRAGARGRGRGRGGRAGNVAGPANERSTQVARQRKDANKAAGANHGRRDQRAGKLARAGYPG
jgi:activating signal cointegrator complex subunit 2